MRFRSATPAPVVDAGERLTALLGRPEVGWVLPPEEGEACAPAVAERAGEPLSSVLEFGVAPVDEPQAGDERAVDLGGGRTRWSLSGIGEPSPTVTPTPVAMAVRLTGDGIDTPQEVTTFGQTFDEVQPALVAARGADEGHRRDDQLQRVRHLPHTLLGCPAPVA